MPCPPRPHPQGASWRICPCAHVETLAHRRSSPVLNFPHPLLFATSPLITRSFLFRALPRGGLLFLAAGACALAFAPPGGSGLSARELAQGYREGRVLAEPKPEMVPAIDKLERAEGYTLRAR